MKELASNEFWKRGNALGGNMIGGKKGWVGGEENQPNKNASFSAAHLSRTNVSCPFLAPSENRDLGDPTIPVFL